MDKCIWALSLKGEFTVKSAYHLAQSTMVQLKGEPYNLGEFAKS